MRYTVAEQKDIVEYARLRGDVPNFAFALAGSSGAIYELNTVQMHAGVRVVLELDLPGHSDIWAFGAPPGVFLDCRVSTTDPQSAVLDVTNDAAYGFLERVFAEIFSRFPERVYHLGGDEVNSACWNRSVSTQAWLKTHPEVTLDQLYPQYLLKVHQMLANKFNRSGTTWCESK